MRTSKPPRTMQINRTNRGSVVNYYGVNYCPRKNVCSLGSWALFVNSKPCPTYVSDIRYTFFIRIFGIEFKVIRWAPKGKRTYEISRPGVALVVNTDAL